MIGVVVVTVTYLFGGKETRKEKILNKKTNVSNSAILPDPRGKRSKLKYQTFKGQLDITSFATSELITVEDKDFFKSLEPYLSILENQEGKETL